VVEMSFLHVVEVDALVVTAHNGIALGCRRQFRL
jgi:hypothetical protein